MRPKLHTSQTLQWACLDTLVITIPGFFVSVFCHENTKQYLEERKLKGRERGAITITVSCGEQRRNRERGKGGEGGVKTGTEEVTIGRLHSSEIPTGPYAQVFFQCKCLSSQFSQTPRQLHAWTIDTSFNMKGPYLNKYSLTKNTCRVGLKKTQTKWLQHTLIT